MVFCCLGVSFFGPRALIEGPIVVISNRKDEFRVESAILLSLLCFRGRSPELTPPMLRKHKTKTRVSAGAFGSWADFGSAFPYWDALLGYSGCSWVHLGPLGVHWGAWGFGGFLGSLGPLRNMDVSSKILLGDLGSLIVPCLESLRTLGSTWALFVSAKGLFREC